MPERIQRRRTKGWRMPKGALYVGRPTMWGNPYTADTLELANYPYPEEPGKSTGPWTRVIRPATPTECVDLYRTEITCNRDCPPNEHPWTAGLDVSVLTGHDLACWCPLLDTDGNRVPCHADVLLELANPGACS